VHEQCLGRSREGEGVTARTEDIHYMGVSGAINFDASGDTSTGTFDISTWKNGQLVLDRKVDTKP